MAREMAPDRPPARHAGDQRQHQRDRVEIVAVEARAIGGDEQAGGYARRESGVVRVRRKAFVAIPLSCPAGPMRIAIPFAVIWPYRQGKTARPSHCAKAQGGWPATQFTSCHALDSRGRAH
jgi:hypothetical protein